MRLDNPRSGTVLRLAVALAVLGAAAGGCSGRKGGPAPRPSVLLVTIDTLRADHVGCYGYRAAATPTLDALAARGVRFATAVAHVPLTGPSHTSILTSRTPLGHGVRDNGSYVLPPAVRSVAEDFRQAGYRTAAFVSGYPLKRRFGLDRGFDTYDDQLPRGKDARRTAYVERTADRTTDAALRWLETPRTGTAAPFFLWVHYFDPHAPYEAPAEFDDTGRLALRRRDLVRGRPARPAAAPRRGTGRGSAARPRHRGPRREPGRARRGHPRHLRLRLDAPCALHPGRPRCAREPCGGDRRAGHRRRADAARLRRTRREGDGGAVAARGGRGREGHGPAGLRGVPPPAAPVWLGPAPRLADGTLQAHRGSPSPSSTTCRATGARRGTARTTTWRASRRCAAICRG